jgi:hypothetical protein
MPVIGSILVFMVWSRSNRYEYESVKWLAVCSRCSHAMLF